MMLEAVAYLYILVSISVSLDIFISLVSTLLLATEKFNRDVLVMVGIELTSSLIVSQADMLGLLTWSEPVTRDFVPRDSFTVGMFGLVSEILGFRLRIFGF